MFLSLYYWHLYLGWLIVLSWRTNPEIPAKIWDYNETRRHILDDNGCWRSGKFSLWLAAYWVGPGLTPERNRFFSSPPYPNVSVAQLTYLAVRTGKNRPEPKAEHSLPSLLIPWGEVPCINPFLNSAEPLHLLLHHNPLYEGETVNRSQLEVKQLQWT
jgi:hypothetical protein